MKKGFIIYALGHQNYYQMAETLAASLIFNNSACKICLLCDDPEKLMYLQLFDQVKVLDASQFKVDGRLVFNLATIRMYEHTPYDITIKLDADMIWLNGRDPMALFEELAPHDIMLENRGHGWGQGKSVWVSEEELRQAYGFTDQDKLYKIYGEFVYFRKCVAARKFFSTVQKIFAAPKVSCNPFSNGTFTDELAYQIACMQLGMELIENFCPVLNIFLGYKQELSLHHYQLPASFKAYSIGGNNIPEFSKTQYNILAKHYYYQLGLQHPYQVRDKKTFLPERLKM